MTTAVTAALRDITIGPERSFRWLTVVPLVLPAPAVAPAYLTLDEALASGEFSVAEVSDLGAVPVLRAENRGGMPVLLVDGEELVGDKQNRIVNLTILVPAHAQVPIPVSCVEAGRWHRRSAGFAASGNAQYARARAQKTAHVTRSLAGTGEAQSDQHWIWDDIAAKSDRLAVSSKTAAMSHIFDQYDSLVGSYLQAFPLVERQGGAVFFVGDDVAALDLFDSDATFRKLVPKLIRSVALDAIEIAAPDATDAGARGLRDSAAKFITQVAETALSGASFPTVGLGEAIRMAGPGVAAAALAADGHVVHLAAFPM